MEMLDKWAGSYSGWLGVQSHPTLEPVFRGHLAIKDYWEFSVDFFFP